MNICTEERFLGDTSKHKMTILSDDGVSRHIRFKEEGDGAYYFDLITWAGHLCVTGDCGTYVFSRLPDMFNFFRAPVKHSLDSAELYIDDGYWAGKLLSVDKHGGCEEFDKKAFDELVLSYFNDWKESNKPSIKQANEMWLEIENRVLNEESESEHFAYQSMLEFEHEGFQFEDWYEYPVTRYTFRFIWNLYAIAWGIKKYDEFKNLAN